MTRVLVTGGAGYIGSHVCKRLAIEGFAPVVYDNLVNGYREFVKWGELVVGDLEDHEQLDETLRKYKPEAVLHFAAHAYVGESVQDPLKYYRNNFFGTLSLLEAMKRHDVNDLVFSSTCATYGIPRDDFLNENHVQHPINPYGRTKYFVEQMISDLGASSDFKSIFLRYFNAAGCDFDLEVGEDHVPETHLIPLLLQVASGEKDSITVFGQDYSTSDGTCIRDYIHVNDLAVAHVKALRILRNERCSNVFNLGNGRGFSVLEVVDAVRRVTGKKVPVIFGDRREGDPPRLVADAGKAKEIMGWEPEYEDLDTIVDSAWRWHQSRGKNS